MMFRRRHIARALGAALILAFALAASPRPAAAQGSLESRIGDKQKELDKIKREIDSHRQKSNELKKQEAGVLKNLTALEKEIDLSRSFLATLGQQEALLELQVDSLKAEIRYEGDALDSQKEALAGRLRQMYMRDPTHRWDVVLGSRSVIDAMRRYKFLRIVADRDAELVNAFRRHKTSLETQSAAMTESLAEMAMVRQERESEATRLASNKQKREMMLTDIRSQKSKHAKAIKRLEQSQKEVSDLIDKLESRRLEDGIPDTGDFAELKGRLPWPVKGKVKRGFGKYRHPTYGTVTFNNGVDIQAGAGTPIQAVAAGVVEFVDWIDSYGKCIIINHGDGYYTLYAHVAQTFVPQGKRVGAGDVIAEVGDTGSLGGFECHFEVRHSKQPLDPSEWLRR